MKRKHLLLLPVLLGFSYVANAQNSNSGATHSTKMEMDEIVSASFFTGTGGGGSSAVEIPMNGADALEFGIESPEIEVTLQCTADYDISIAASANNFTYSGSSTIDNLMPVSEVLSIMITENTTGGTISSGMTQYQAINGTQGKLAIDNGQRGVRKFKFKYKAQPGFEFSAGTYTTDIVYTLTKR